MTEGDQAPASGVNFRLTIYFSSANPEHPSETLHELLDEQFGEDGEEVLVTLLESGLDPDAPLGSLGETALHVATRRRRLSAVEILLGRGPT